MSLQEAAARAASHKAVKVTPGFSWTEIPRWYEGSLYFSDMYNHCIPG
jgi:hypothetical protein